ncbi:MAG: hypothetical protein B0W54_18325 [Cellvibrio sp. 79]|nr:MAG: hypothetical protein B0W54_18325 [Cellvibrio sp. 79]
MHREVAVAVINRALILLLLIVQSAVAAVLPDERIDVLYHGYDGGGAKIDGPSILVRKNIGASVSVAANYYVDTVSSASIDVVTQGSKYAEERKETGVNGQYLIDRSTISLGYVSSKENDYDATTYSFGIDQSFFGDLTTLGFGVSFGEDVVGQNIDPTYQRDLQRRKYSINASQIVTKNLLMSLSIDTATDQCLNLAEEDSCLNNPYRSYRFMDERTNLSGLRKERYPHTRNSDAIGLRGIYHLPWSGSVRGEYRTFSDSWGVESENYEIRYTHSYNNSWIFETKVRVYDQTAADFYADVFPFDNPQNFKARDKELSTFSSLVYGLGVTYKLPTGTVPWFEKSSVNLYWDHFDIDYDNFRDARLSVGKGSEPPAYEVGEEPLYSLQADVIRLYFSFWF